MHAARSHDEAWVPDLARLKRLSGVAPNPSDARAQQEGKTEGRTDEPTNRRMGRTHGVSSLVSKHAKVLTEATLLSEFTVPDTELFFLMFL